MTDGLLAASHGGCLYTQGQPAFVENNTIIDNTAGKNAGAGIYSTGTGSFLTLLHVTVVGNI